MGDAEVGFWIVLVEPCDESRYVHLRVGCGLAAQVIVLFGLRADRVHARRSEVRVGCGRFDHEAVVALRGFVGQITRATLVADGIAFRVRVDACLHDATDCLFSAIGVLQCGLFHGFVLAGADSGSERGVMSVGTVGDGAFHRVVAARGVEVVERLVIGGGVLGHAYGERCAAFGRILGVAQRGERPFAHIVVPESAWVHAGAGDDMPRPSLPLGYRASRTIAAYHGVPIAPRRRAAGPRR